MDQKDKSSTDKSTWSLRLAVATLVGTFAVQYYTVFGNLLKRWREDFEYCYLVPFIFLYLVYTSRESLKARPVRSSYWGLPIVACSGFLYLAGELGSIETTSYLGIWLAVVGSCYLVLGGDITKALAFAFLILAFIVPLPPFLNRLFTFKLKLISSGLSVKMMQAAGLSAFGEGNIIDLGMTQLQVVDACSGLRYVYPLLLMGLLFGYFFHRKWWKRVVILLATIPISIFSNALRIAITGYLSIRVSQEAADTFFHGFSGWLIFMVSLAFLVCLSWLLKTGKSKPAAEAPERRPHEVPPARLFNLNNVRPLHLWMASMLFVVTWGLNTSLASVQLSPPRKSFGQFPVRIGEWNGEKTYVRQEILGTLWADDYVQIRFTHSGTGRGLLLFIPYYEYQGTRHTAHSPVSCLVGGGFAIRSRAVIEREWPRPFGNVKVRQMILEKDRDLVLSNYWFQQRGRIIVSEYANKWYLFWDSISKRRTDGAIVRIEMLLKEGQGVVEAQAVMDSFTRELMQILPQYVPN